MLELESYNTWYYAKEVRRRYERISELRLFFADESEPIGKAWSDLYSDDLQQKIVSNKIIEILIEVIGIKTAANAPISGDVDLLQRITYRDEFHSDPWTYNAENLIASRESLAASGADLDHSSLRYGWAVIDAARGKIQIPRKKL